MLVYSPSELLADLLANSSGVRLEFRVTTPSRGLATNLKELGIDDLVIQRILRHGDVGTTQKSYIKVRNVKVEDFRSGRSW